MMNQKKAQEVKEKCIVRNQKLLTSLIILKLYCYLCFSGIFCARCSCQAHLCTAVSVDCHRAQQVLNSHRQNIKVYRSSRHIWVCTAQCSHSDVNFWMNRLTSIMILALLQRYQGLGIDLLHLKIIPVFVYS